MHKAVLDRKLAIQAYETLGAKIETQQKADSAYRFSSDWNRDQELLYSASLQVLNANKEVAKIRPEEIRNEVWTCTAFKGRYPTGTCATIIAETQEQAKELLELELARIGLAQDVPLNQIAKVDRLEAGATIDNDGNY